MTQQTEELLTDSEITLADLESSANPILDRIKERLLKSPASEPHMGHPSHASSPGGKGHNSYVNGRFEDAGSVESK